MKFVVIMLSLVISGCATIQCTVDERNNIMEENNRLILEKKKIESEKIYKGYSLLSEKQLLNEKINSYNSDVRYLEIRAAEFNRVCAGNKHE